MSMPSDVRTEPSEKIVFNAPFTHAQSLFVRLNNMGTQRLAWAIKTNKLERIVCEPGFGLLDPRRSTDLSISLAAFNFSAADVAADRLTLEWVLAPPDYDGTTFQRECFTGDGVVRRKNLKISYNV